MKAILVQKELEVKEEEVQQVKHLYLVFSKEMGKSL